MNDSNNTQMSLDDEIEDLKGYYLQTWKTADKYHNAKSLFEKATYIKDRFRHTWRTHEKSFLLDLFQAFGVIAMLRSNYPEADGVMQLLRKSSSEMHDPEKGGYRNNEELLVKLTNEVLYICAVCLDSNKDTIHPIG